MALRAFPYVLWAKGVDVARKAKKLGKDDPRRVIHSLKVGLALTLISLYYYFQPLYEGFGVDAMWAVLTVVLVFEFSVGATIGKVVNRTVATFSGGALGVGVHRLASLSGETGEPILLACFIFLVGSISTFTRFYPTLKARYDYGLLIFILTFCLVTVSAYRDAEIFEMAHQRVSTVIIGCITALVICVCICPVWIGADLHNLVAKNIEQLGNFLEGFGCEYFATMEETGHRRMDDKSSLEGYKSVLTSKATQETMANLARWEPCHGGFRFFHPWKQYLKVGNLARQCAYKLEALNSYLNCEIQTAAEIRSKIQEPCIIICSESGKALKELATTIKGSKRTTTTTTTTTSSHIEVAKRATENLKSVLEAKPLWEDVDGRSDIVVDIIPVAAVASLLISIVTCVHKISEAVHELASLARFKSFDNNITAIDTPEQPPHLLHQGIVVPISEGSNYHHVITVDDGSSTVLDDQRLNNSSSEPPVLVSRP